MRFFAPLLFFFFTFPAAAQVTLSGRVLDAGTKQPLAFVNVHAAGTQRGTSTDIDGYFSLKLESAPGSLRFSYIGYQTQNVAVGNANSPVTVYLRISPIEIEPVDIRAGENPAHRIIRNANANRARNNPEKALESFSYTAYNKFYLTADLRTPDDTTNSLDTAKGSPLEKLLRQQHLFMSESVSERSYIRPGRNSEKVIASRISGLQRPEFTLLSTQLQSFSFYGDFVNLFEKAYLNPLADGAIERYLFIIEDTTYVGADTVFIISFQPRRGKKFEALKGVLSIGSKDWEVRNVSAEPNENSGLLSIKIQQNYAQIDGKQWFPVQLHTDWYFNSLTLGDTTISAGNKTVQADTRNQRRAKAVSRSYINNIRLDPGLKKKNVGVNEISIADDAAKKNEDFWRQYRDTLNSKEARTYQLLDSLGKAERIDQRIEFLSALATGKYPLGPFDLDLERFINFNNYEGFRFGAGMHTSRKLVNWISVGGYGAYGLRDKAFKYGADGTLFLHKKTDTQLRFAWAHDIIESGGIFIPLDDRPQGSEAYRRLFRRKFDNNDSWSTGLRFRAFHHFTFDVQGSKEIRSSNDEYRFGTSGENISVLLNEYTFTEARVAMRFAYREKFVEMFGLRLSEGTKFPVLWLSAAKGFSGLLGGDFDYMKYDLKLRCAFRTKYIGRPEFMLLAGYVDASLPYTQLYAGRGTYDQYSVAVHNTFETMGVNEFLSDRYAAFFYAHSFDIRGGKKFRPTLVLRSAAGLGALAQKERHVGREFLTMEKGYYESGLELNNLVRSGFTGLGVAAFYRYGPYAKTGTMENLSLKFTVNFIF